jgi:AcrR family transcriptional regulator
LRTTDVTGEEYLQSPAIPSLKERKSKAVRESIWNVAIDLFSAKGYDETTVEDIARAAGISLRSFFRYFASKGDLMAYTLLIYGNGLAAAIDACAPNASVRAVFRESISRIAQQGLENEARTRKHLDILSLSQAASAAEMSRLSEVQARVTQAYERRLPASGDRELAARALAGVSLHLTGVAVRWCLEHRECDLTVAMDGALAGLEAVFCRAERGR